MARAPAAVETDVEAAPVIDGGDHRRRRLGVRTSTKVRSRRGSGDAQRDESDRTQQDLLHGILSGFLFASLGPEALINSEGRAPRDLISNAHHYSDPREIVSPN